MSYIKTEIANRVLTITLARADKKNALTFDMYQQMADAINAVNDDTEVKAVLIKGEGGCFTAGNDLGDFASNFGEAHLAKTVNFMQALMHCPLPVVAQVQGLAVGIGTTMLMHCDLVYCQQGTVFKMPFIDLGLVPEYASSYVLPKLAGHRKAAQWLLLGEAFGPDEAKTYGLVNEVLSEQELPQKIEQVMAALVAKPRKAMLHSKALMKSESEDVLAHMNEELDVFVSQLSSEAAKEAFDAFLQKRKPDPAKFD